MFYIRLILITALTVTNYAACWKTCKFCDSTPLVWDVSPFVSLHQQNSLFIDDAMQQLDNQGVQGPQFSSAECGILSQAAEFLCFRGILQNQVIRGQIQHIFVRFRQL